MNLKKPVTSTNKGYYNNVKPDYEKIENPTNYN